MKNKKVKVQLEVKDGKKGIQNLIFKDLAVFVLNENFIPKNVENGYFEVNKGDIIVFVYQEKVLFGQIKEIDAFNLAELQLFTLDEYPEVAKKEIQKYIQICTSKLN